MTDAQFRKAARQRAESLLAQAYELLGQLDGWDIEAESCRLERGKQPVHPALTYVPVKQPVEGSSLE